MYEPDQDELIYREQIYSGQINRIRKLYPSMPLDRILCLTSQEATILINSTHGKLTDNSFRWLKKKREVKKEFGWLPKEQFMEAMASPRMVQVTASAIVSDQHVSAAIRELHVQIKLK